MSEDLPRKILVVDDDPGLREVLTQVFLKLKCEVVSAVDGHDALARLQAEEFTVVMCDIQMPRMNGVEFLDALRARNMDIPVVVMTGMSNYTEDQISKHGGVVLLRKPFTYNQLKELLEEYIELLPLRAG